MTYAQQALANCRISDDHSSVNCSCGYRWLWREYQHSRSQYGKWCHYFCQYWKYIGNAIHSGESFAGSGAFVRTSNMTAARADHWARLLSDGTVVIVGGKSCVLCKTDPAENSAELYDPSTGKFTSTVVTFTTRGSHNAFILADGTVVIAGGIVLQDGRT